MSRRLLHVYAHPASHRSRVNRPLAEAVKDLDGVDHVDLYARYPDFDIDVPGEQRRLLAADIVILQHPFFWYSSPAILKEWQDLVLEYGFAYGDGGTALQGKSMLSVISTGGMEEAYCPQGHNCYSMEEFLRPFEQTARLCGMEYLPPFIVHGTHRLAPREIGEHAASLRRCFDYLLDGSNPISGLGITRMNEVAR